MICDGLDRMRSIGRAVLRVIWLAAEILRGALQASLSPQRGEGLTGKGGAAQSSESRETSRHFPAPHSVEGRGRQRRARWLHHICRRVLRAFAVQSQFVGTVPKRGLLVANHLSYLDILLLGSLSPCVFVGKSEVKSWPVFGWFARTAGTVFVDRNDRRDAARTNEVIRAALREGALVVLFPEGTSSDGSTVLPFKSSLLESAIGERVPISVAALRYELSDGDAGAEVCYWGEHTLVPHLIKLLSKRKVKASIAFSAVPNTWRDRKKLAAQLHSEVSQLHVALSGLSATVDATRPIAVSRRGSGVRVRASSHRLLQKMVS
jgi:lyso-ornithine lipid O-acyltransferase